MSLYIICGSSFIDANNIKKKSELLGISTDTITNGSKIANLYEWREKLLDATTSKTFQIKPTRAWEVAASEIFLGNLAEKNWGIVDSNALRFTDFWHEFDPSTCFIFIYKNFYSSIKFAILNNPVDSVNIDDMAKKWILENSEMLKFFNKYPDRVVFVDERSFLEGGVVASLTQQKFELSLTEGLESSFIKEDSPYLNNVLNLLIIKAISIFPDVFALEKEIESCLDANVLTTSNIDENKEYFNRLFNEIINFNNDIAAKDVLIAQFHKAQEELDKAFLDKQSIEKSYEERLAYNQNEINDINQENELLLIQLHQVQEELEIYFLKYQDAIVNTQGVDDMVENIMQKYPNICIYQKFDAVHVEKTHQHEIIDWSISGLKVGRKTVEDFTLTTTIIDNQLSLMFEPSDLKLFYKKLDIDSKLNKIIIAPFLTADASSFALKTLRDLSGSDIAFLMTLTNALENGCENLNVENIENQKWLDALTAFKNEMKKLSNYLRFDDVKLKREHVNQDYEHLWFELVNASFGNYKWSSFEFRFSASLVKSGKFSFHPKLEFPLINGKKPFESWFEESEDDFGAKYELRFEVKKGAMDINAWNELGQTDQALILAVMSNLDTILRSLEGQRLARDLQDWIEFKDKMITVANGIIGATQ